MVKHERLQVPQFILVGCLNLLHLAFKNGLQLLISMDLWTAKLAVPMTIHVSVLFRALLSKIRFPQVRTWVSPYVLWCYYLRLANISPFSSGCCGSLPRPFSLWKLADVKASKARLCGFIWIFIFGKFCGLRKVLWFSTRRDIPGQPLLNVITWR